MGGVAAGVNRDRVAPASGDVQASAANRETWLSPHDRDLLARLRAERDPNPAQLEREWRRRDIVWTDNTWHPGDTK
jgi:hypothetical protein